MIQIQNSLEVVWINGEQFKVLGLASNLIFVDNLGWVDQELCFSTKEKSEK
jgi:hypothetical protein